MVEQIELGGEFFAGLEQRDKEIAQRVAAAGCLVCGEGALHRSDYGRKPRGGLLAHAGEACVKRFSFCCDREGCRKRTTPPSVRFLGRRVYLGAVVIVASMLARVLGSAAEIRRVTGVPPRTTRRWLGWWCGPFVSTSVFIAVRARLIGVDIAKLPASIVEQLPGSPTEQVHFMLAQLAPLTTGSVPDGARFLRGAP
jgi:hypothetical protein